MLPTTGVTIFNRTQVQQYTNIYKISISVKTMKTEAEFFSCQKLQQTVLFSINGSPPFRDSRQNEEHPDMYPKRQGNLW